MWHCTECMCAWGCEGGGVVGVGWMQPGISSYTFCCLRDRGWVICVTACCKAISGLSALGVAVVLEESAQVVWVSLCCSVSQCVLHSLYITCL